MKTVRIPGRQRPYGNQPTHECFCPVCGQHIEWDANNIYRDCWHVKKVDQYTNLVTINLAD